MTTTRQRWPSRLDVPQVPTVADLACHVYRMTYQATGSATTRSFPVLALDEAHAAEVGDARMAECGDAGALILTEVLHGKTLATMLHAERADEWQDRQRAYQMRQEQAVATAERQDECDRAAYHGGNAPYNDAERDR